MFATGNRLWTKDEWAHIELLFWDLSSTFGNGLGEVIFEDQNLKGVRANCLHEDEIAIENGLLSSGDVPHSSLDVVTYSDEEIKGSEPLNVHPFVVVKEHGEPYSVSSDLVVERVKSFCCVVGLSWEGFEDQLLALFPVIDAWRGYCFRFMC